MPGYLYSTGFNPHGDVTNINVGGSTTTTEADITGTTEDTSPDKSSDYLLTYDTSAGSNKKTLLKNALPYAVSTSVASHTESRTTNSYDGANTQALTLTTPTLPAGKYKISFRYSWSTNVDGSGHLRVHLNDSELLFTDAQSLTSSLYEYQYWLVQTLASDGAMQIDIDHYRDSVTLTDVSTLDYIALTVEQLTVD